MATHVEGALGDLEGASLANTVEVKGRTLRISHMTVLSVIFLLSALVSSMYDASPRAAGTKVSCTSFVEQIRRIRFLHIGVCIVALAILFGTQEVVNYMVGARFKTIIVIVVPLVMSKFCLLVLRSMVTARTDGKLLNIAVVIVFSLNVMVSLTIRIRVMFFTNSDFLKLFATCLAVSAVEFMARMAMGLSHLIRAGYAFRRARINGETLSSLTAVAGDMQHRMDLHYGQLWIDQFSEVFVIMLIFLQQLGQPVWAQYLTWDRYAEYESRIGNVLIGLLIQLGVELLVDSSVLGMCYRFVPIDRLATFRRLRSKSLVRPLSCHLCLQVRGNESNH